MSGVECRRWRETINAVEASGRPFSAIEIEAAIAWRSGPVAEALIARVGGTLEAGRSWIDYHTSFEGEASESIRVLAVRFAGAVKRGHVLEAWRLLDQIEATVAAEW